MKITGQTLLKILFTAALCAATQLHAQDWKQDRKINLVFGLTQPLLVKGFNIEGNYIHKRLIFDYSHGISLDFSGSSVTTDMERQHLAVHMPYTTGFGVGYRFTSWLNLRVEPKWHRFEFYYAGEPQNRQSEIASFNTFSLGLGLYAHFQPFQNQKSFLKGIMLAPSIRFWPTASSTLKGAYTYNNKVTLAQEEIKTPDPGIAFTPVVFNISIGYSFDLQRK